MTKIHRSSTTLTDQSFTGTVAVGDVVVQTATGWARRTTQISGLALVVDTTANGVVVTTHGQAKLAGAVAGTTYYLPATGHTLTTTVSAFAYGIGKKVDANEDAGLNVTWTDADGKLGGGFSNGIGFNSATGKIEEGVETGVSNTQGKYVRNTDKLLNGFFNRITGSGASTTFDSTGDVNISTIATATTPNTSAGNNARFYVKGGASVFDNAGVDGNEICEFRTDRSWSVYQRGVGAAAKTQLMSNNDGRTFSIADQTNEDIVQFISNGVANTSSFNVNKAFCMKGPAVAGVAGGTNYTIDDIGTYFQADCLNGPVNFILPVGTQFNGRYFFFQKFRGNNLMSFQVGSGQIISENGGAIGSTYTQQNTSGRYYLTMWTDGFNYFVLDDNIETTRLVTVPAQVRTSAIVSFASGVTSIEGTTPILIGSFTFTNTKSVPVNVMPRCNFTSSYALAGTGSYSIRQYYRIAVGATNYMNVQFSQGGYYINGAGNHFGSRSYEVKKIPVAAGAAVQIDYYARNERIESSFAGTVSGTIGFTENELIVVNQ